MAPRLSARMHMRWRMIGLLLAVIVSVALPYAVTRSASESAVRAAKWVAHTAEIKADIHELSYALRNMEAATYSLLQGLDADELDRRISEARAQIPKRVADLRALTVDNPEQQLRLGRFNGLVTGRLVLMEQARQRYKENDVVGAYRSLADAAQLFRYRQLAAEILDSEQKALGARTRVAEQRAREARLVYFATTVAQLLILGIVVVISEGQVRRRLRAEDRAQLAMVRAQTIVETVREPIAVLDEDLSIVTANAAFFEFYGGQAVSSLRAMSDTGAGALVETGGGAWDDDALLQRLTDVISRDRELWDYEMPQTTIDGVERCVLVNARRMLLPDSDARALLLTVSDVTARKLAEDQIGDLNRQLEGKIEQVSDVNRELEAFSYSVSHDLRAPLRHIGGFSEKLRRHLGDTADEKSAHYMKVIYEAATHMAQLIEDLLVYSRLGRGALRLQPVDMQSLVDEARALVQSDVDVQGRNIQWQIQPLPVVVGDDNMLRTVWQNLIGNAVKYSAKRDPALIEIGVDRADNGDYVFTVSDNGAGFDMDHADKLFGVFQRMHKASEFSGSGIGLANVRRIIARHGGRTWGEGVPDQGASFHFSLPSQGPGGASPAG